MLAAGIFVFAALCVIDVSSASVCSGGKRWVADPDDCSSFWLCLPFMSSKYRCPGNTVTNSIMQACVPRGSRMDTTCR